jgi:16S rRNA (guanine(966)-N(2))-methyltransferase RsmD
VRIIAGLYKGRRLHVPTWTGLRPTSDKLRETLFNIVAPRIEGARVLDVYAGTGAVGLEALSRGASEVVFVERDRRAAALIRKNVELCGVRQRYTIVSGEAGDSLGRFDPGTTFDLIFLDPPYDHPPTTDVLDAAGRRLAGRGWLVVEHAARGAFDVPADLDRVREVRSGDSALTFLARRPGPELATEQR